MRAIVYGLLASVFFSTAFIFNRAMQLDGGSWLWSSSLRFFWMAPILLCIVALRGKLSSSLAHLKQNLSSYVLWSTIGFGLFYAPLTFASIYAPGWLVAGSWQVTLIAGSLLIPVLALGTQQPKTIPWRELKWTLVIILGVLLILLDQISAISWQLALAGFVPVVFAAFMYPLGNRKMMALCQGEIETPERVLNMTLASLPFWTILALCGAVQVGLPSTTQLGYSLLIAIFSGVIATLLFFSATNMVRHHPAQLAIVEATQAGEVLSTLVGEMLFLGMLLPSATAMLGIVLIMLGMIVHSLASVRLQRSCPST